jgi:hypothetical protein
MTTSTAKTQELTDKLNESITALCAETDRPSRTKPIAHGSKP